MVKINISGGEPFLRAKFIGEIIRYCKQELNLESTGIICNGSKVTVEWLDTYGQYLDIMGVSCDSFDDETNFKIGRSEKGKGVHTRQVFRVAEYVVSDAIVVPITIIIIRRWCHDRNIMFKLNTVVNKYNWEEDLNDGIDEIRPFRWKVARDFRSFILVF